MEILLSAPSSPLISMAKSNSLSFVKHSLNRNRDAVRMPVLQKLEHSLFTKYMTVITNLFDSTLTLASFSYKINRSSCK